MSRTLRLILVTLACLLATAGTVSRLHHHTGEGDAICFCTDSHSPDGCDHHHDGQHSHDDDGSCPFKLDEFKLSADGDLSFTPDVTASSAYIHADCGEVAAPLGKIECGHYRCRFCKSPVITRFGLRSPPSRLSC